MYNKVQFADRVLIDLTEDTVTPDVLKEGETAHDNSGAQIVGTWSGGTDTSDATATASDMLEGATAYAQGEKITGTIPTVGAGVPAINIDGANITATVEQAAGYIAEGGVKTSTASVPTVQQATPEITVNGNEVTAVANQSAGYVMSGSKASTAVIPSVAQAVPNIAFSGATVIATAEQQAGYVAAGTKSAQMSIPTATQATPAIAVDNATGKINATATQSAGYVSAGTKSSSAQLPTVAGGTIVPTQAQQTAISSGAFALGSVIVDAIPSSYVQPSGTSEITANGVYDVRAFESASVNVEGYSVYDVAYRTMNKAIDDTVTYISSYAFINCSYLSIASFANVSRVYTAAFSNCVSLATIHFPNVSIIDSFAFNSCKAEIINLPNCNEIGSEAFRWCSNLKEVFLSKIAYIGSFAFRNCRNISRFDLTNVSSVPTANQDFLENVLSLSIFVPQSLYGDFLTANRWSQFSSRMVSV